MTLYHITLSGVVAPCQAQKKTCRYRGSDHFRTREDGKTALSQREAAGYTKPSMLRKDTRPPAGSIKELKAQARRGTDPELLGDQLLEIVEETLPFNFSEVLLTHGVAEETGEAVRETYSSLAQSSRPLKNKVRGVRPREVKSSLTFVPDRVKTLLAKEKITSRWSESRRRWSVECSSSVPVIDTPGTLRRLNKDSPLSVDLKTGRTYWLGQLPRSIKGYQVASSYRLEEDGRTKKVKGKVHALGTSAETLETNFRIPNTSSQLERREAILHGYSHLVQDRIEWARGRDLFEELAVGSKYSSTLQTVVKMGFPHERLGVTGKELFPISTAAFFFPEVRDNYWILDLDAVRINRWTAGVWVKLAFCDLSSS